jgi:hypothetical protein
MRRVSNFAAFLIGSGNLGANQSDTGFGVQTLTVL